MSEKTLLKAQSQKKTYDLNIGNISEKLDLVDFVPKKTTRRCFLGLRHVATLVGFLTCFLQNAMRMVLGVGIVAMVKHSQTNESSNVNASEISCPLPSNPPNVVVGSNFQGEFDWSTELQGYIVGIGFLSFLMTNIPAGRLVDAVGSKTVLVLSSAISGILILISPFAARWHVYALMAVQFLRGAAQGFTTPTIFKLISNWIPRNERGTLSTLVVCGFASGIAISGMVTGWICDVPGLGWPSAFYIFGIFTVLLSVIFHFIYYEYPEDHPWITEEELNYITDGLETKTSEKKLPTPWKKMLSSIPSYAYFYGLFGHYWATAYFISVHPAFMGTILHYPMTQNGILSSLPVLLQSVGGVFASLISYWISKKNLIGLNKFRKITTVFGAFGFSLCMAGILLAECDSVINIMCFALSLFLTGIGLSGIMIAGVDMAPAFAGSLMGIASTFAGTSCALIPIITGLVTSHETLSEWRIVFWINLGVVGSSGLIYTLFGSAEVQSWNYSEVEQAADGSNEDKRNSENGINLLKEIKKL
ncbi:sodium-dependent phosphate transport protein 3-like [Argiope bruennichi]|uniref:sodium-dependent phosphate transport protein 3-like n=1 Tax=Argiope bruennichi TaxID=94029 RepID=UPI002495997D|nr:sodium-dependent phosphate transport protein 3-like [Argiope bruennichi]